MKIRLIHILSTFLILFLVLCTTSLAQSSDYPAIHISELYLSTDSDNNWIELYNNSPTELTPTKIKLKTDQTSYQVSDTNSEPIPPNTYFIIAQNKQTLSNSYPDLNQEQIYESSPLLPFIIDSPVEVIYDEQIYETIEIPTTESLQNNQTIQRISQSEFTIDSPTPLADNTPTPTPTSNNISLPHLLLNEFNLEQSQQFIEIIKHPNTKTPLNITLQTNTFSRPLILQEEQLIYTIPLDPSEKLEDNDYIRVITTNDQEIDSVCFSTTSSPPPTSIKWLGNCIQTTNTPSIQREHLFDTNTSNDWSPQTTASPGALSPELIPPESIINIEQGNTYSEDSIDLKISTINSPDLNHEWYLNSIPYSTESSPPNIKINTIGQHELKLITRSKDNLSSTAYLPLTVIPKPIIPQTPQLTNNCVTPSPTPTITPPPSPIISAPLYNEADYKNLIIKSILPNPDSKITDSDEWIEIANTGTTEITLTSWQLDDTIDGGSKPFPIPTVTLTPGETKKYYGKQTHIALNNSNDSANLISPDGKTHYTIEYSKTEKNTPLTKSQLTTSDTASSTIAKLQTTKTSLVSKKTSSNKPQIKNGNLSTTIKISELQPNPKGTDKNNEWLEINNFGLSQVNLGNWTLDINEKTHTFPNTLIVAAQSTKIINTTDLGISLPNNQTKITLKDFNKTSQQTITYDKAPENKIYSYLIDQRKNKYASTQIKQNYKWLWLANGSPGDTNPIIRNITGTITALSPATNSIKIKESITQNEETIEYETQQITPEQATTLNPESEINADIITHHSKNKLFNINKIESPITTTKPKTKLPKLYLIITATLLLITGATLFRFRKRLSIALKTKFK